MISPEDRTAQKKRWYEANKADQQSKGRAREKKRRDRRRALLSCPCFLCGDPDDTVIQWHHVDESEKEFELFGGSGSSVNEDRWWLEVLKCIPLCANCHIKIHKDKLCLLKPRL